MNGCRASLARRFTLTFTPLAGLLSSFPFATPKFSSTLNIVSCLFVFTPVWPDASSLSLNSRACALVMRQGSTSPTIVVNRHITRLVAALDRQSGFRSASHLSAKSLSVGAFAGGATGGVSCTAAGAGVGIGVGTGPITGCALCCPACRKLSSSSSPSRLHSTAAVRLSPVPRALVISRRP